MKYFDANNLCGWAMSRYFHYDEINLRKSHSGCYMDSLEDTLNTPDDSDIGYFVERYLSYPDNLKKQSLFHFVPRIRKLILIILQHIRKKLNQIFVFKLIN